MKCTIRKSKSVLSGKIFVKVSGNYLLNNSAPSIFLVVIIWFPKQKSLLKIFTPLTVIWVFLFAYLCVMVKTSLNSVISFHNNLKYLLAKIGDKPPENKNMAKTFEKSDWHWKITMLQIYYYQIFKL